MFFFFQFASSFQYDFGKIAHFVVQTAEEQHLYQ